jgi:hypothetical protein
MRPLAWSQIWADCGTQAEALGPRLCAAAKPTVTTGGLGLPIQLVDATQA